MAYKITEKNISDIYNWLDNAPKEPQDWVPAYDEIKLSVLPNCTALGERAEKSRRISDVNGYLRYIAFLLWLSELEDLPDSSAKLLKDYLIPLLPD